MKHLLLIISLCFLLCDCANSGSKSKIRKTNRSYSNIDRIMSKTQKQKAGQQKKTADSKQKLAFQNKKVTPLSSPIKSSHPQYNSLDFTEITPKTRKSYYDNSPEIVENKGGDGGHFKVGNPYQIEGVSYFPENYEEFEESGMASWYGPDFHGNKTANGETYDSFTMTAAHPTLPMPSMVRVTNLRNGKSVIVRVNDRGPFSKSRIIDVSEKAADELEFKDQGTTEVRIQLLRDETEEMLQKIKNSEKINSN